MYLRKKSANGNYSCRSRRKDKLRQTHYAAIFLMLLFVTALFIEISCLVALITAPFMLICFFKGELWECKDERSERK